MNSNSTNTYHALALLGRILLAAVFLISGLGKLAASDATIGYITAVGIPAPTLAYALAATLEVCGGALLIAGYKTRLVAALLAIFSVVTALFFHRAFGDQTQVFNFLKNVAMAGGLIQVVVFGAGAYSFDGRRKAPQAHAA